MTSPTTADLMDLGEAVSCCELPLQHFGGRHCFAGSLRTVSCRESYGLVEQVLQQPGRGHVLVVDGGGSRRAAVFGGRLAGVAVANDWAGVVLNAAIRDVAELRESPLGVLALGSVPRRGVAATSGATDVAVNFGGVTFTPGCRLTADEDGVVVAEQPSNGR